MNKSYIIIQNYKHLKRGDRVVFVSNGRDSGYPVCLVHNGDGNIVKPMSSWVLSVKEVEKKIKTLKDSLESFEELLGVNSENH